MDADFWQQARIAPFGLHSALAANNISLHSHTAYVHHHQQHLNQPPPPMSYHTEQMPSMQVHTNHNVKTISQDDSVVLTEQHHHEHQQIHTHHEQHQQIHNLHNEEQHAHLTHLSNEQSHHLLFNAAAAAAAAAHLSGVVKSNELSNGQTANDDSKVANNNIVNSGSNNNCDHQQPNTLAKQETSISNVTNDISVYGGTNITNNNTTTSSNHTHSLAGTDQHQQHAQLQYHKQQPQDSLKFEQGSASPETLPLEALQHQIQQQIKKQQKHGKKSLSFLKPNEIHPNDNQQQLHAHHRQPLMNSITNKSDHCDQQQQKPTTSGVSALPPTSPLQTTSLVHHLTPTSSPHPSLTSPSASSSTPDLKFSNENNKLPNELQLQLSRSNSAAAISERTLEECWSTLQRVSWHLFRCLFMHKSAMQQMQQQIPRSGLGTGGSTGGIGAESKPHQCQQCMKSFSSNHQLVQHIRVHTGEKPYKCSYCDRRFKQLSHVQQHTRLHTGERPYKCHLPDCGRAFIQLSNLQQHLRNHDAQVERAKNRPFHCNICGKGFATESSLRTHTSKELQLHLGVLQQHAALIGGPNASSCPVCHKLFLGTDALMEHMKHVHKEKSSQSSNNPFVETICGSNGNNLSNSGNNVSNAGSSSCLQSSGASSSNDPYLAKRRTANHPCPVCGKHYVNEGSLRKHLACHTETSQLTNSLRMWPCSVCQAVFTYENGLLTHMEHMRMDPKHQFAAQYVLSRAAAERRERDNILAATLAASSSSSGAGLLPLLGENSGVGGGSNSLCPSPSANSECSSNGRQSSSAASDPGSGINLLNSSNNNNNIDNNNINNNNSSHINNNCNSTNSTNSNLSLSTKLNDMLRSGSNTSHPLCRQPHSQAHPNQSHSHTLAGHSYGGIPGVDSDIQNHMNLMAAASAAAVAVAASANNTNVAALPSPQRFSVESTHTSSGSAAVQAAVVNLAAAMRLNHSTSSTTTPGSSGTANGNTIDTNLQHSQNTNHSQSNVAQNNLNGRNRSPVHHPSLQTEAPTSAMNVMRDSMMRTNMMETSTQGASNYQQEQQQQATGHTTYTQSSNPNINHPSNHQHTQQHRQQQSASHLQHLQQSTATSSSAGATLHHLHQQHNHTGNTQLARTVSPPPSDLSETNLHMQQTETLLRSHTETSFRMASSVIQQQCNEIATNNNNKNNHNINNNNEKHEPIQQSTKNSLLEENSHQKIHLNQNTQDISEAIRLQEHRLEQALRLHNDTRTFHFLNPSSTRQQQQQPNNTTIPSNSNTSNTTQTPQQHHHTT